MLNKVQLGCGCGDGLANLEVPIHFLHILYCYIVLSALSLRPSMPGTAWLLWAFCCTLSPCFCALMVRHLFLASRLSSLFQHCLTSSNCTTECSLALL